MSIVVGLGMARGRAAAGVVPAIVDGYLASPIADSNDLSFPPVGHPSAIAAAPSATHVAQ